MFTKVDIMCINIKILVSTIIGPAAAGSAEYVSYAHAKLNYCFLTKS